MGTTLLKQSKVLPVGSLPIVLHNDSLSLDLPLVKKFERLP